MRGAAWTWLVLEWWPWSNSRGTLAYFGDDTDILPEMYLPVNVQMAGRVLAFAAFIPLVFAFSDTQPIVTWSSHRYLFREMVSKSAS